MGGGGWFGLGGRLQNARSERLTYLGRASSAGRILGETRQSLGDEALPPEAHGLPTRAKRSGNVLVIVALSRQQDDLGTEDEPSRRPPTTSPLCKLLTFGLRDLDQRGDAHGVVLLQRSP